jgi:hypothetical protein
MSSFLINYKNKILLTSISTDHKNNRHNNNNINYLNHNENYIFNNIINNNMNDENLNNLLVEKLDNNVSLLEPNFSHSPIRIDNIKVVYMP